MNRLFKDKEHLVRAAGLFLAGIVVFVIARAILVPKGFGQYGHYRGGALADVRSKPVVYAGRAACVECHTDEGDRWKGGKHKGIGCEACHGALAKHAADPSALKPEKPDPKTLCLSCHAVNVAKPAKFPQIDPKTHMDGGACTTCHDQHAPDKEPKK
jgi:hypothetical protein